MRDALTRLIRAVKRLAIRVSPVHRRRRRFNVHLQASPSWQLRAERAVELWTRNAAPLGYSSVDRPIVVGDLGCGNERLREVLAEQVETPFTYQGYDLHPQRPTTIRLDAARELPKGAFDLVFTLGLLEYLGDLEGFLARIRRVCRFAILSYVVSDTSEGLTEAEREARGWLSHHSRGDFDEIRERTGWLGRDASWIENGPTALWLWESPPDAP